MNNMINSDKLTVKELREFLATLPDDMPIGVHNGQGNYGFAKCVKVIEMSAFTQNGFETIKELLINNEK